MIELIIISKKEINGLWQVTYKHYIKGDCACTAEKITRSFNNNPSHEDLLNAV